MWAVSSQNSRSRSRLNNSNPVFLTINNPNFPSPSSYSGENEDVSKNKEEGQETEPN